MNKAFKAKAKTVISKDHLCTAISCMNLKTGTDPYNAPTISCESCIFVNHLFPFLIIHVRVR